MLKEQAKAKYRFRFSGLINAFQVLLGVTCPNLGSNLSAKRLTLILSVSHRFDDNDAGAS
jgi:hypothetical protein